ncbi:MAG: hypothetical protein ACO1O1_00745 [Adhaeribacter sp.]
MNRFILLAGLLWLCAFASFAQNPGGQPQEPAYPDSVSKTDPIEIRRAFFSTFYQNGEPLPASLIREVVAGNPAASREMQLARRNYLASIAVNTLGSFLVAFPVASAIVGRPADWKPLLVGAGLIGSGIPLTKAYFRHAEQAATLHNQSLARSKRAPLQLGFTGTGAGLLWRF